MKKINTVKQFDELLFKSGIAVRKSILKKRGDRTGRVKFYNCQWLIEPSIHIDLLPHKFGKWFTVEQRGDFSWRVAYHTPQSMGDLAMVEYARRYGI
jgi:hypothetical protein